MKRTFVGLKIEPDKSFTGLLHEVQKSLPDPHLQWVNPAKLHLTLRFLGNTKESQIALIIKEIDHIISQFHSFTLEINGLGFFGSRKYPRILWAGIKMPGEIFTNG